MNEYLVFSGAQIYSQNNFLKNSAIIVKNNKIEKITSVNDLKNFSAKNIIELPDNFYILPGFIDMHIHGARGKDTMDANFESLSEISKALLEEGTTSFLATTMTASKNKIESVLTHVGDYIAKQNNQGAEILGVHLEGPFLSANKVGAQNSEFILNPDIELFSHWQKISKNNIKLVTLAPELPNSLEFINYLNQNNIIASIGHTDATFAESIAAIKAGCHHVTHLFNAMRGMHQREPGVVGAALLSKEVNAELIVDGVHLHPAIVELAFQVKTANKLVLVTDAMRAKCMHDGVYDLGGQAVIVKHGIANLENGTLAGSTLKMSTAIKNMLQFTQCTLNDIVKMTSENPAKALGIFPKKGCLAANSDADFVVLNENYELEMTVKNGFCSDTI